MNCLYIAFTILGLILAIVATIEAHKNYTYWLKEYNAVQYTRRTIRIAISFLNKKRALKDFIHNWNRYNSHSITSRKELEDAILRKAIKWWTKEQLYRYNPIRENDLYIVHCLDNDNTLNDEFLQYYKRITNHSLGERNEHRTNDIISKYSSHLRNLRIWLGSYR